jgi:hypothetical protein
MMFWFKKKKIVVDCFTQLPSVYDLYKVEPAMKFYPEEIKRLPTTYDVIDDVTKVTIEQSTIRKCIGLIDHYKQGAILPLWTDIIFQPKTASEHKSSVALCGLPYSFDVHDRVQYSGLFESHIHMKLSSPWKFKESTGVKFMWNSPVWNLHKHANNFVVVPGTVSYNYQSTTNVNIFVNSSAERFVLPSGTPMVHIVGLTDNDVVFKNHLIDEKEYYNIGIPEDFTSVTPNRYNRWVKQKHASKTKCPFGFGK